MAKNLRLSSQEQRIARLERALAAAADTAQTDIHPDGGETLLPRSRETRPLKEKLATEGMGVVRVIKIPAPFRPPNERGVIAL